MLAQKVAPNAQQKVRASAAATAALREQRQQHEPATPCAATATAPCWRKPLRFQQNGSTAAAAAEHGGFGKCINISSGPREIGLELSITDGKYPVVDRIDAAIVPSQVATNGDNLVRISGLDLWFLTRKQIMEMLERDVIVLEFRNAPEVNADHDEEASNCWNAPEVDADYDEEEPEWW